MKTVKLQHRFDILARHRKNYQPLSFLSHFLPIMFHIASFPVGKI